MVISVLAIMASMITDFITHMLTNNQIAKNVEHRIQARYLAQSSLNFSKLLLYYSKKLKGQIEKAGVDASMLGAIGYQPLYKMFPLSSEMIKGVVQAQASATEEEDASLLESESLLEGGTGFDQEKVDDFLDFSGNFSAEIIEEESKYSLNAVTKMSTKSSSYDLYKRILISILQQDKFKNYFDNHYQDAEDLVHALADFADSNTTVNEFDQVERGREGSGYDDSVDFKIKNSKYLSLSEVRLVAGMNDDIYTLLEPYITVYHTSNEINVCMSPEDVVDSLIILYTKYGECTTPIREDDTETLEMLRNEVLSNCPDSSAMASALNVKLGIQSQSEVEQTQESGTAEQQATASKASECKVQFEDFLTDDNNVFTVKATGQVGEVYQTINVVLDTSASTPSSWKTLYYQVQ